MHDSSIWCSSMADRWHLSMSGWNDVTYILHGGSHLDGLTTMLTQIIEIKLVVVVGLLHELFVVVTVTWLVILQTLTEWLRLTVVRHLPTRHVVGYVTIELLVSVNVYILILAWTLLRTILRTLLDDLVKHLLHITYEDVTELHFHLLGSLKWFMVKLLHVTELILQQFDLLAVELLLLLQVQP